MKVIYVAGPFRGRTHWDVVQNVRRSEELALEIWKLGHAAISPHLNTANFDGVLPDQLFLDGDLEILKRCDAVLLCPNFQNSKGTMAEIEFSAENDIPVFSEIDDRFKKFLKEN